MRHEDSLYPQDWLRIAEKDLGRAELLLNSDDPDAAGFYLQQSIEKYLKAFLLAHGWSLKRSHDLEALLNEALVHDTSLEQFRELCQKVTAFYFVERYPFQMIAGLGEDEVRDCLAEARRLAERLRLALDTA